MKIHWFGVTATLSPKCQIQNLNQVPTAAIPMDIVGSMQVRIVSTCNWACVQSFRFLNIMRGTLMSLLHHQL